MKGRVLGLLARKEWQPLWRFLHRVVERGLGFMNPDPRWNGEDRHLAGWARELQAQGCTRPVILDVGANEGDFAAGVLALLPDAEVHCFEPHPATGARLAGRFAADARVRVRRTGVGDRAGTIALYDYGGGDGTAHASFLGGVFTDIYRAATDAVPVEVVTLDAYLAATGVERVDLVKIDVEGYERHVLAGMAGALAAGRIGRVLFEFNAHNALIGFTLHQLAQMLPEFDVYRLLANGLEPVAGRSTPYDARVEVYAYANYVAVRRPA
ncbi:MAG: FkbM family methyltransferase [Vicinamibacteria bacterium]